MSPTAPAAPAGTATALGLAAAAAVFFLWIGGTYSLSREIPARALLWGVPVALAALILAERRALRFPRPRLRALRRACRRGRAAGSFRRRRRRGLLALAILLFVLAAKAPALPPPLPSPRGGAVVVIAVDGLELDAPAPTARRSFESFSRRRDRLVAGEGGVSAGDLDRSRDGRARVPSRRAGARARPARADRPPALRPPLGTSWYLRRLGPALRLVVNAPVSASDRRRLAFWEVAASAGLPASRWDGGLRVPGRAPTSSETSRFWRGASDGISADRRAIDAFEAAPARRPASSRSICRAWTSCGTGRSARAPAGAEQLHRYLEAEVRARAPGRRLSSSSRPTATRAVALGAWSSSTDVSRVKTLRIRPEDVAASILARAGVPAARDLPGARRRALPAGLARNGDGRDLRPAVAPGSPAPAASDREYLEKLKSLGYLN